MAELLEAGMIISFGFSWPMSIAKAYRARTTTGKSLFFLCFVLFGYLCGIAAKFVSGNVTYVCVFYIINFIMVSIDLCLYFRNRRLDKLALSGNTAKK